MEKLEVFKNKEFGEIRTVTINNEPYFVGKDVAQALGYRNTKDAIINHVSEDDKRIIQRSEIATIENNIPQTALPVNFVSADIPNRGMTVINESGLYALIFGSKLESAKRFKHWVTAEVLPSIRKHGMYAADELLDNPDLLIKVATELKEERQRRQIAEEEREQLRQELDYSKDWYSIKRVAAMNGVNWKSFDWRRLKQKSIQLGYGVKKIFDANYGEVNTYHREVWEVAYPQYEI